MKKYKTIAINSVLIVFGLSVAFSLGYFVAKKEGRRSLAITSLFAVEPALRVSEIEAQEKGRLPRLLVVDAEGAILSIARQSMLYHSSIDQLPMQARNILCVLAKERFRHKEFFAADNFYDEQLMAHLKNVHERLAPEGSQSNNVHNNCTLN
ncbi:MAG: hypothetical protein Q7V20_17720 [Aquabacterium sp.]|uniref:hypothetical protein n=1 Tax=Aquabacterium sp. TaxID=1872578 RepID=UPI00271E764A|nr:hypothetical protein [Aquabacterium sp.]MDO9005288.1 hypothetical protein [Aquabacterium sp.]